ncbi:erythroferrone isoform X5 [Columba livia]|uniref:erythroferrone isoform X5 n=1 Tax=Columba livia TaxID=8932 RepID=UPI0031BAE6BE
MRGFTHGGGDPRGGGRGLSRDPRAVPGGTRASAAAGRAPRRGRGRVRPAGSDGMRLPELCLALLCAAAGLCSPGAARERPPGPGAAVGRAVEAGRVGTGAVGGVDPRQVWMLLAGSPGWASGSRHRGRTGTARHGSGAGTAAVPAGGPSPGKSPRAALRVGAPSAAPAPFTAHAALEELLRELQLLLKGMVKEQVKTHRKAGEECEEEEESDERNPQDQSHHHVEAAFHCRTRENISVEKRTQQELQFYYIVSAQPAGSSCLQHPAAHGGTCPSTGFHSLIQAFPHAQPEAERMFHRGSGLNLTSGQYTAPTAGYYTFTATLHIVSGEQRKKERSCRGNRLRVLICVQSRCQHNSNLETVSQLESCGDLFTISVTGVLYMQAGQYASVFVDNAAGFTLTIQSGSDFSAILLGV